jgi:glutamine amidotransferase-like uncharacterized protein
MKPTIALFIYDPKCSVQSANGIMQALGTHYNFKIFSKNTVEDNFFDNVDMIAVPGGFGDADTYRTLLKNNQRRVREFVDQGGKYLGICMGAYWAGSHYFDLLDGVDAVQYMTRPGTDTRRPHAKEMPVTWRGQEESMFWYDGCAFVGNGRYKTIATYANSDPMAIIQGNLGLIGCHPEAEEFWYTSYSYMRRHWTGSRHHRTLLEFTDLLMRQ